jgi:hypothetical protein
MVCQIAISIDVYAKKRRAVTPFVIARIYFNDQFVAALAHGSTQSSGRLNSVTTYAFILVVTTLFCRSQ